MTEGTAVHRDRMSDFSFHLTELAFWLADRLWPTVDRRVRGFDLPAGITLVDYGCGPGRYTLRFARLVGAGGRVYAVDVQPLAIAAVRRMAARNGLTNVTPVLAEGYRSGVPDQAADVICALDMFFAVGEPSAFLAELRRIVKPDGLLIIDDGHQPRAVTKRKLASAGGWTITEERRDHLRCRPA